MIPPTSKMFSLNNTDLLVFVMEMDWVLCEVGPGVLFANRLMSLFKRLSKVELKNI
jgi:hypothetical protein